MVAIFIFTSRYWSWDTPSVCERSESLARPCPIEGDKSVHVTSTERLTKMSVPHTFEKDPTTTTPLVEVKCSANTGKHRSA